MLGHRESCLQSWRAYFVALHPDNKKIFKWWQKLELRWVHSATLCPLTSIEKPMTTSMQTDCLTPPGWWSQLASPGYVLACPKTFWMMKSPLAWSKQLKRAHVPSGSPRAEHKGRDIPSSRPYIYVPREAGTVFMFRSKTDTFLSLEDTQVRAQTLADVVLLLHFSSITQPSLRQIWHCTPQWRLMDPGQTQHLHWGSTCDCKSFRCFHKRVCLLSVMPKMGTNVSAYPQSQRKSCALCCDNCAQHANITKQQGNALHLQIHTQDGTNCPTCFVPAQMPIWSPNPSSFHCRGQTTPRLPKCCSYTWAVSSGGFE